MNIQPRAGWVLLTITLMTACGPFDKSSKSKGSASNGIFQVIRASNASTAGVATQSTLPLRMFEGGIANLTTDSLTFNRLTFHVGTNLNAKEFSEFSPRLELQFGALARTEELAISHHQAHEANFTNLNATLTAYPGDIKTVEQPKTLEDLNKFGGAVRVLIVRLRLNKLPEPGTTFTINWVSAETKYQLPRGILFDKENHKDSTWLLNRPGFNVEVVKP